MTSAVGSVPSWVGAGRRAMTCVRVALLPSLSSPSLSLSMSLDFTCMCSFLAMLGSLVCRARSCKHLHVSPIAGPASTLVLPALNQWL